jgi:DNA-binding NtrC family response regulator
MVAPRPVVRRSLERSGGLYGACPAMLQLFAHMERVAPTSATAMILGESGSGKELVARRIHELSARSAHPFVAVNCGALPETLIESELFGHERGSFTGAARTHHGCFERADKGTLLLDEIAEMPADMQVRLLRVLESGRFTRVGGSQEITADVRVLAATNRSLDAAVREGKLREDLMYRLCVIPIEIPPLRDRDGDVLLLAEMFLQEHNREHGSEKRFSAATRERIAAHPWPGNVRELRNVVYRAFVLCDGEVEVGQGEGRPVAVAQTGDVGHAATTRTVTVPVGTSLDEAERALILATLDAVAGSKVEAAGLLGISLKTLYNRLQAYRGLGARGAVRPAARRLMVVA